MKDEELFELFVSGKKSALEIIIIKYQKPLYGYLVRYTGDTHLAEEIFQDTFIKILQKKELYLASKPFKPWLYQIALNTARDKLRHKKAKSSSSLENKEEFMTKTIDSPAYDLACKEIATQIQEAVSQLPEVQKQVFILREYEKMSYADISVAVQRPLNTVKSDMRRALQSLRHLLESLSDIALKGETI